MKHLNLFTSVYKKMTENTDEARPCFKLLGIIILVSYGLFYFFNLFLIEPNGTENIYLRIFICILGALLLFHQYWEKKILIFSPIIFYFTIFFSFGFFFSYMLFKNPYSIIWQLNELTGLVLLSVFLDWRSFSILTALSILSSFYIAANESIYHYKHLLGIFGSYSAPIICLLIFAERKRIFQKERDTYHQNIKDLNESLEVKIVKRTEDLQKALTVKTDFLNNISHEIRTPIHGVLSISEGLVDYWQNFNDEKKHQYAYEVHSNAKRLSSLVDDILELSPSNTIKKMPVNLKKTVINKLLEEVIEECSSFHPKSKNLNIKYTPKKEIIANIDSDRIKQAFRNIISNAIKFTAETGEISINLDSTNQQINISVLDTGIGIPENELKDIFTPFSQSSRSNTGAGGKGLGLSIAQNIITAHKGKIWAENNKVGATFYITLPN
jgi:signal transduction histidine kinase